MKKKRVSPPATKDDLKAFATKDDLKSLEERVGQKIESNSDLLRQDFMQMRAQFVNDMHVINENLLHKFQGSLNDKISQHEDKIIDHEKRLQVAEKRLLIF